MGMRGAPTPSQPQYKVRFAFKFDQSLLCQPGDPNCDCHAPSQLDGRLSSDGANDYLTLTAVSNRFATRPNNTVVKNAIQTEQKSGHDAFEDCKSNPACTAFSWDFSTS